MRYFLHSETLSINLPITTFIAVGAKVMILWNINTSLGIVNGTTEIIKDFMFKDDDSAPSLPYCIIVECVNYKGPPSFTWLGKEKWVPIRTGWGKGNKCSRENFPVQLAWALSVWKS